LVAFDMLNLASVTPLILSPELKTLGPLMVPAMTWFPVTSGQVVVEHTGPLWAFGGTNGFVPPQVPPPFAGGTAGYWAVQPALTGVFTLGLTWANSGSGLTKGKDPAGKSR
jgi:hypothetical protein